MILGSKPLSDMTEAELHEAIAELRSKREALRDEAIKKSTDTGKVPKVPKEPKMKEPIDPALAAIYANIRKGVKK